MRTAIRNGLTSLVLLALVTPSISAERIIHPEDGYFLGSKLWFQLQGDEKQGLFRSYAGLLIEEKLADFPNLFVAHCGIGSPPYVTMHFPESYKFKGFESSSWLPKTNFAARSVKGTFQMISELNKNEFHVDLGETEFDYFADIWTSDGPINFKLGPEYADVTLILGDDRVDAMTSGLLADSGKVIRESFTFVQMRTRCIANSLTGNNPKNWLIFGSVECVSCDRSAGKTIQFITVEGRQAKKPIRSRKSCEVAKKKIEKAMVKNAKDMKMKADLLCIQGT